MVSSLSSSRWNSSPPQRSQMPSPAGGSKSRCQTCPQPPAGAPAGQPPDDLVVVDDELEHHVERGAVLGEQLVEHLGLVDGAREAVEQEAVGGVVVRRAGP